MHFTVHTEAQREAVIHHIKGRRVDRPFEVEVRSKRQKRSVPQNRLLWAYYMALAVETGNDKDVIHEYYAERYLPKRTVQVFGREVTRRWSTTEIDKGQFSDYIDRVRLDMEEKGYPYPSPDSPLFEDFMAQYRGRVA